MEGITKDNQLPTLPDGEPRYQVGYIRPDPNADYLQLSESLGPGNFRRIARGAGFTPGHVSRVLRGERGTNLMFAARIAAAAGVTLDQLYTYVVRSGSIPRGRKTLADRHGAKFRKPRSRSRAAA